MPIMRMDTQSPKELVLVIGGARSGKSSWALKYSETNYVSPMYLATAEAIDGEMEERIRLHKEARGDNWALMEEPVFLGDALRERCSRADVVLIDCVTVWLGNLIMKYDDSETGKQIEMFFEAIENREQTVVVVANEVGCGVVPPYPLGRRFRDLAGRLNQDIAKRADRVFMTVAGIAIPIKMDQQA
jgi:adenosylcobinamide kinase/adenosylcobinamide-phosphate guanylyltransferase